MRVRPGVSRCERAQDFHQTPRVFLDVLVVEVSLKEHPVLRLAPIFRAVGRHDGGEFLAFLRVPMRRADQVLTEAVVPEVGGTQIDGDARLVAEI